MTRLYFYKVKSDTGAAPCVDSAFLSLAICKPRTRASATIGDWIFGFGSVRLGERLIYIAQVTAKLAQGDYYRIASFASRLDSIYEWSGPQLRWRIGARFHPNGSWAHKDVGEFPTYERARVLLSSNFRYFGREGSDEWKALYPALSARVEALTQGERVNHDKEVRAELIALRNWAWAHFAEQLLGEPSDEIDDGCDPCRTGALDDLDDDEDDDRGGPSDGADDASDLSGRLHADP